MKFLKPYSIFESIEDDQFLKNKEDIRNWLRNKYLSNFEIQDDLSVNIHGSVDLFQRGLEIIPVQFGRVNGHFSVGMNRLKSLKGCPVSCGSFNCTSNQLKTLKFGPKKVDGSFSCSNNQLTTFEGWPEEIDGYCSTSNNIVDELFTLLAHQTNHSFPHQGPLKLIKYINDNNILRGNKIIFDELKDAFYMLDFDINENNLIEELSNLKNYVLIK